MSYRSWRFLRVPLAILLGLTLLLTGCDSSSPELQDPTTGEAEYTSPPANPNMVAFEYDVTTQQQYTFHVEFSIMRIHATKELTDAPPGKALLRIQVEGAWTITNTTEGQTLPRTEVFQSGGTPGSAEHPVIGVATVEDPMCSFQPEGSPLSTSLNTPPNELALKESEVYCGLPFFLVFSDLSGPPIPVGGSVSGTVRLGGSPPHTGYVDASVAAKAVNLVGGPPLQWLTGSITGGPGVCTAQVPTVTLNVQYSPEPGPLDLSTCRLL